MDGFEGDLPAGLALRPLGEQDVEGMARHANNAAISRWMRDTFAHPYETQHARRWIAHCTDERTWAPRRLATVPGRSGGDDDGDDAARALRPIASAHAITLDGECVGSIGLEFKGDVRARTAELGYWLAQEHWGRGYATAVVRAFVAWVWRAWPYLARLEAGVFAGNAASERVLARAGFAAEGVLRGAVWKAGRLLDLHMWGLLRAPEREDDDGGDRPAD